jgi:hypothetical protein
MRRLRTRGLIGLAVVAIAMVFAAAQAMATVVDKGFYSDEPYSDSYNDCGFPVLEAGRADLVQFSASPESE